MNALTTVVEVRLKSAGTIERCKMSKSTFQQALVNFSKSNGADPHTHTDGPSLTRQEFAEECDVNHIMKRYETHVIGGPGMLPPSGPMQYIDFQDMPQTLLEYMEFMRTAENAFMSLPAIVRKEFDNDPVQFVAYASDPNPEHLDQMRTWGLAPPAPKPPAEPQGAAANAPKVPEGSPPQSTASPAGGASTHGPT